MALFPRDYTLKEQLMHEKEFLGYYWHSPLDMYHTEPGHTIQDAKNGEDMLIGIVDRFSLGKTKRGSRMGRISVSDGKNLATVIVWEDELDNNLPSIVEGAEIRILVNYDETRGTFTVQRGTSILPLETVAEYDERIAAFGEGGTNAT
jgi:DNA polymerase III alpha subunit